MKKTKENHICVKVPMKYDHAKNYLKSQLYSLELN